MPYFPRDFAQERSHRDVESTGEYGRLMVQIVAAANGLAATAVLTLIGAIKNNHLAEVVTPALACYLTGLFFAIRANIKFYEAQDKFAGMWERRSYQTPEAETLADQLFRDACQSKRKAFDSVNVSLLFFIVGGLGAALSMHIHFSQMPSGGGATKQACSIDCSE